MKTKLFVLNLALSATLAFLGRELQKTYLQVKSREEAMLSQTVMSVPVPLLNSSAPKSAVDLNDYQDTITKNLFSPDRSPAPIPDPPEAPPPPPPQPPFPVLRGLMLWAGMPPTVVMSTQKGSNDQHSYHIGERVGDWKILSIDRSHVGLEWNQTRFQKRIDELMDVPLITMPQTPASPESLVASSRGLSDTRTESRVGANPSECSADDKSVPGTVRNGRRKIVRLSSFGVTLCTWEMVPSL